MTEYTLEVNGKRFKLNEEFREAIETRAELEYEKNHRFSCWWSVASPDNYSDEAWEENIHEEGDPILTIETEGIMVPWERLDQLEARMPREVLGRQTDDKSDEIDSGNGLKSLPPEDSNKSRDIFGQTHFPITPHRYDEVPSPESEGEDKIPPKPEHVGDDPELVVWIPIHPDIDHTWEAGEAITPVSSWVEWNIQQRANQPQPNYEKQNTHDSFESLCKIHGCEKIGEYEPSDEPSGEAGQVERKGKESYEDGRFGGDHWNI